MTDNEGEDHTPDPAVSAPLGNEASAAAAHPTFGLDREDRLPWLEAEDRYNEYRGVNNGRVAGVVAGALALMGAIVGGVWYTTHRHPMNAPVADGSVVAAPSGAVKEAPADPGGKTFAGTGDASFAMSQGQSHPAQLAADAARTAADAAKSASATASSAALAAASAGADAVNAGKAGASAMGSAAIADAAVAAGAAKHVAMSDAVKHAGVADAAPIAGGVVQVGAYSTSAMAEAGWSRLAKQYDMLAGLHHRIVEGQADIGTVFRLQAIPAGAAGALCDKLRAAGAACQVKK